VSGFCSVVLVETALAHLDRVFTYSIPDGLTVHIGSVVRAPFRGKRRQGVVTGLLERSDIERPIPLTAVVGPGLDAGLVDLARWVAARYLSTMGEALATILPQRVAGEEDSAVESVLPHSTGSFDFRAYSRGPGLSRALKHGGAGFVWRPLAEEDRASAIVAMAGEAAKRGGVLVLLPEVRVRSRVLTALRDAFGGALSELGSHRSARERYRDWLALHAGAKRIAVGGRAAVFAPIRDLRLIVVDDEGHQSYKEGRAPRYHARAVAAERARRAGATLVLVGVPPSVEARAATERGPYALVAPPRPEERRHRPSVTVVEHGPLVPSAPTLQAAKESLAARRRVVLITHRGGAHTASIVARAVRILAPSKPAQLGSASTPADVARAVRSADLICATPFIAKDLAVERVGLLGLLDVDAALSQPEYRAPEDTFATWWRAARWTADARIFLETANASHPAILALTKWDPDVLYRAEAARRRELGYPPFATLARIDVPADRANEVAKDVAAAGLEALGPVEKEGRTVVVARARRRDDLLRALEPLASRWRAADEPMRVDVDPWEVFVPKWRS
jgi:primosomal protein N' (replication factor Y)